MFETLFTIGSVELRCLTLLQLVALIAAGFVFWKRGREEHYPEAQLFDGFLLSSVFGLLVGRIAFVILNWKALEFSFFNWMDVWSRPGVNLELSLLAAGFYLFRFARSKKWDAFEVMDFWVMAVSLAMVFLQLGYFLAGTYFGIRTSLPWGVIFPSVFEKHHPTQLYSMIFYAGFYAYLYWLEFQYRSLEWYRAGKKTAETGFLLINFLIFTSLYRFLLSYISPPVFVVAGLTLDRWFELVLIGFGIWLLLRRSHRSLFSFKQKKFFAVKN
ncbi:MAG: hypothetical protein GF381_01700 [Candidatus Pacebacteria bacterium]|nr:hypothetical protein [Candidatus Paceibacterota bacterium]